MKFRQLDEKYGSRWTGSKQWKGRKKGFEATVIHNVQKGDPEYFWFTIHGPADNRFNSLWQGNGKYATFNEAVEAAEAWIDEQPKVESSLTVYWVNYNGRRYRMVGTHSRAEAARLCRIPIGHMKDYGGTYGPEHPNGKLAYENPGTVYESAISKDDWNVVSTPESRREADATYAMAFDSLRVKALTGVKKGWVGKVQSVKPEEEKPITVSFPDGTTKPYTAKQLEVIDRDRDQFRVQLERSQTK